MLTSRANTTGACVLPSLVLRVPELLPLYDSKTSSAGGEDCGGKPTPWAETRKPVHSGPKCDLTRALAA
eukprot:5290964-Pyramimonas_sp.AAC.1